MELQPLFSEAHVDLARALVLKGQDEEASSVLHHALELDRPPPEAYSLLGKVDLRQGDYRGAIMALNHYVAANSNDSDAYYLLSRAYRGVGDTERMNRATDLYKKTSVDSKERGRAQRELEVLNSRNQTAGLVEGPSQAGGATHQP